MATVGAQFLLLLLLLPRVADACTLSSSHLISHRFLCSLSVVSRGRSGISGLGHRHCRAFAQGFEFRSFLGKALFHLTTECVRRVGVQGWK